MQTSNTDRAEALIKAIYERNNPGRQYRRRGERRDVRERIPIEERFIARLYSREVSECWSFDGFHGPDGYARFSAGGIPVGAHRVSYELFNGPIPDGLEIDHLCANRGCVNPNHLEAVTHAENVRRSYQRRK